MARKTRLPKRAAEPRRPSSPGSDDSTGSANNLKYVATANPENETNTKLHVDRYREQTAEMLQKALEERREHFRAIQDATDWSLDHRHLINEMDVSKFVIADDAQRVIYSVQSVLVDSMYRSWGKTPESWEGYTLMFRNGFPSKDERKPVAESFQRYCEEIYCPVFWTLLFGRAGWEEVRKHWAQFKACTIKVCESGMCYGDNIFHMHIDGKVGILEPNNFTQRHMSRLLFSIVTDVVTDKVSFETAAADAYNYCATNYPVWQPRQGFRSNHDFHKYMQGMYLERGLENTGLPRPHYEIPEPLIYRARSGEVLINRSHADPEYGCQPIHSEPNPCPDRHLFVFDWNNIPSAAKGERSVEVPEETIIALMRPLEDASSEAFKLRMREVVESARGLLAPADAYPEGRSALECVIRALEHGTVAFHRGSACQGLTDSRAQTAVKSAGA